MLGFFSFLSEDLMTNLCYMQGVAVVKSKDAGSGRVLSATFADLPAPGLNWEKMAAAPVPRLDGAAIQIKNLLYVFAGYGTIDSVRIASSRLISCFCYFSLCFSMRSEWPVPKNFNAQQVKLLKTFFSGDGPLVHFVLVLFQLMQFRILFCFVFSCCSHMYVTHSVGLGPLLHSFISFQVSSSF